MSIGKTTSQEIQLIEAGITGNEIVRVSQPSGGGWKNFYVLFNDFKTWVSSAGSASYINITLAALQTLITGSEVQYPCIYQVTDAVSDSKIIIVFATSANTVSTLALNLTDNTFGNYNTGADTFTTLSGNLPAGGATGQVLVKNSDADFDCSWEDVVTP